ncbi:butyrophilin subfamily 3 member A2-like isoform X2 [Perca fluviatilis]|uniref:butyrophilin subfamily 3 member A2-like isoform X2 n=1 Tax=Perca fluviatilis TaxID=8168 RepID=UPI0019651EFC|nr:butyrophilin subfamily 3 member A2-like isoform X2 [Perca fluviatilis]
MQSIEMTGITQQKSVFLPQMDGLPLQAPLRPLRLLVVYLHLIHSCRGQSQLIGPSQPIVATVGDDVILPCSLEPTEDVAAKTLEWTRSDLNPIFVLVWRAGQDYVQIKHPSFKGRTWLFPDELKHGNISLKLSKVKPSDAGRYKCYIPKLNTEYFVDLVVGAVSLPVMSLAGIDEATRGVVLQCESKGWCPEPEVLWLDGEGNLLSAGPTETARGPDDLYTVSSRVTVEKRHSNRFTCRVQQKDTNQTRETEIHVTDDFFEIQSSSSVPINTGLAVSLAVFVILFIMLLLFSVWKWRQNKINSKISHRDVTGPSVTAEEAEALTGKKEKKIKLLKKQLQDEQKKKEEAEKALEELMAKNMEEHASGVELREHEDSEYKEDKTGSANQSSATGPVIVHEVGRNGNYIRLRNTLSEDQQMGEWNLEMQINDTQPITYTFPKTFKLKADRIITIAVPGYGSLQCPTDLIWRELKSWTPGDKLKFTLTSNKGEIKSTQFIVSGR